MYIVLSRLRATAGYCGEGVAATLSEFAKIQETPQARGHQKIENLEDLTFKEPLTYDQYQRERKKLIQEEQLLEAGNKK